MPLRRTALLCLAVLLALPHAVRAEEASEYLLADPSAVHRVDYVIITGDDFAGSLDALAAHREEGGYAVGIVTMSALRAHFTSIGAFLAHAVTNWKEPAPSYVLLVGDVDAVPTVVKKGAYREFPGERDLATDFDYARPVPDQPLLHVGRFPCDTRDELGRMIQKTIDYETQLEAGPWQRKINFIASVGGYGAIIDGLMERMAMSVVSSSIPATVDVQGAYGNPHSPFCPYPPAFNQHVIDMFNGGSLLTVFVGHGAPRGVATIEWKGRAYAIFDEADAPALAARHGLPIFVAIACHTGRFDIADCLGETYFKLERGPVAFVGGSRVTQPYANGLFVKAFVDGFFGDAKTLGEVLTQVKESIVANRLSPFSAQVNMLGGLMQGKAALAPMRADVVQHYNLLGDPALVIRRPTPDFELAIEGAHVRVHAPGHEKVELTLECGRLQFLHELPQVNPNAADVAEKMADRYEKAHDRMIGRWSVDLTDGEGEVDIELPGEPGVYFLKANDGGSVGAVTITVAPPEAEAE